MLYRYVEREGAESTRVTIFLGGEGIRRFLKPGLLRVLMTRAVASALAPAALARSSNPVPSPNHTAFAG
jgi:hypothetical protein